MPEQCEFRSVTHGTCALGGVHTPGSEAEAECPLRSRQDRVEARQAIKALKAAQATPAQLAARANLAIVGAERLRQYREKRAQPAPA